MKLKDITNSKCDVRKYMKIGMCDEEKHRLSEWHEIDIDVIEDIIKTCWIYVKHECLDEAIEPFDLDKFLEGD